MSGGFAIAALGLAVAITVTACGWTEKYRHQTVAEELNRRLGQYKENLIVKFGQPTRCVPLPKDGGEVCEWRTSQGQLFYWTSQGQLLYYQDARGIARAWAYTDPELGQMESVQYPVEHQPSEGSVMGSMKEIFRDMRYGTSVGGGGPSPQ